MEDLKSSNSSKKYEYNDSNVHCIFKDIEQFFEQVETKYKIDLCKNENILEYFTLKADESEKNELKNLKLGIDNYSQKKIAGGDPPERDVNADTLIDEFLKILQNLEKDQRPIDHFNLADIINEFCSYGVVEIN